MKRKMSLFVTASMVIASIGSTVPAFASELAGIGLFNCI